MEQNKLFHQHLVAIPAKQKAGLAWYIVTTELICTILKIKDVHKRKMTYFSPKEILNIQNCSNRHNITTPTITSIENKLLDIAIL